MEFKRAKKINTQISLIPLINVIFLLLIFFMVAGSIEGVDIFEVNLPQSTSGNMKPQIPSTVYLSSDGKIAINNDIVAKDDLKTILHTLYINYPNQQISIKSDLNVPAETLIYIMNAIKDAGGNDVSLVTQVSK
ncbi:MAG: biopolymer transporter ExbD [Rickettsiales bacterium]|nr:biopolymer transporter ExbD [Pseudomonadota bacterium]MDA0966158.1 biopolymer transporter ExbD [Pseudomonadota bacterium]MDG4543177.1 biopolymer transporter ExbD [Rickettsiales bacterium]MDG4545375.1 biopolymer transporter ExbD [Rickettsiales bacterium]MDG4547824.1 biopolymer transporter ExbD [Rickettsiales bacterium]